jgi:hypothetical protein
MPIINLTNIKLNKIFLMENVRLEENVLGRVNLTLSLKYYDSEHEKCSWTSDLPL